MFDGDIYYKPSVTGKPLRLTATDQEQHVVNGLSDWTYEGRMYSSFTRQVDNNKKDSNNSHGLLKQRRCS